MREVVADFEMVYLRCFMSKFYVLTAKVSDGRIIAHGIDCLFYLPFLNHITDSVRYLL